MKRLDAYIVRELTVPFITGTVAVAMMFSINQLMAILKEISIQSVPREAILQSLLYKLPFWLNMTLPVGVALAASLAFTRLTRESELTAMRAAGTPIFRTVLPVALFGVLVGIANFFLVEKVMPVAEKRFNEVAAKVGILGVMPEFRSNAVVYLKDYTATIGSVVRGPNDTLQLTDIMLVNRAKPGEVTFIMAKSGNYKGGKWLIKDTFLWQFNGTDVFVAKPNKDVPIDEKIVISDMFQSRAEETQTAAQLREAIATGSKTGLDTRSLQIAYHTRFSVPTSCVIFAAIAPIFAILFARTGGFAGVLLSIFLVMLYYNAFIVSTEIFGRNGWMAPVAAAWLPNVVFLLIGIVALRRLE